MDKYYERQSEIKADFDKETANHVMTIIKDDGLIALSSQGFANKIGKRLIGKTSTFLLYRTQSTSTCMSGSRSSFKPSSKKSPQAISNIHRGLMKPLFLH